MNATKRTIASPLAKRLAQQNNMDLSLIQGSGPKGRIIKFDIEQFLKSPKSVAQQTESVETPFHEVDASNIRKIVAKRLTESKQTIPHFYLKNDCEIDKLLHLRKDINERLMDGKVSVNDMIIKACALALKDFPDVNASWMNDKIRFYDRVDISVAVATPTGLMTPIIRNAAEKKLTDISAEIKELATRAKDGKLKPEEFQGGCFSVSNLGMFGIKEFSAIINPPQSCILAVGAGEERPIIKEGNISKATIMTSTLSVDHRVVDGALGAEFLAKFKKYLEDPISLLIA